VQDRSFDRLNILKKYGLHPNLPVYLLGTGANGINHHLEIVKRLIKARKKCQVIALCGSNHQALLELRKIPPSDHLDVVALSQVGAAEMVSLLRVADLMVARPGAGLTTEAIVTGCPMIFDLTGGSMPQEQNNLNFWKSKTGSILSFYSVSKLINILQGRQPIPRVEIPLDESPNLFLDALIKLVK
jgi:1,2-diacylglycerol 3-beta-galactosyltransferase